MEPVEGSARNQLCLLAEGPRWGDARFLGKWLLHAHRADMLWKEATKNGHFCKWAEVLADTADVDLCICAICLVCKLKEDQHIGSFFLPLSTLDENFLLMVGMEFFHETGNRYQMAIPRRLDVTKVKKAAMWIAESEDDEQTLHPERILKCMSIVEAKTWQERLSRMDQNLRLADRQLLMDVDALGLRKL
jgi:hypothetical protein